MNSMGLFFVAAVAIASVASMPQFSPGVVPVLDRYEVVDERGQYSLRYITGDGTTVTELGKLKLNADGSDYVLVKEGTYTYTGPDGITITLNYIADENGFRAAGNHLPVAPVA